MKGLIEVFYEPGKVFDNVRDYKTWVAPILAGFLLFLAFFLYMNNQIGAGNIARHRIESSPRASTMTPEQKEAQIAVFESPTTKAILTVVSCLAYFAFAIVGALLFMAIAGVSGGPVKFSQALGTVGYATWPISVLRTVLSVFVIFLAAEKGELDPQHLLAFDAGAILDRATAAKPLYAFASMIDILLFAEIALAAYGLARVARIGFAKSLTGMILIWFVFTLIAIGLSFFS